MKIAVVSDTHGAVERLMGLKDVFDTCDYLFFLGDGEKDFIAARGAFKARTIAVAGNNDLFSQLERELTEEVDGTKFFLTHGHLYGVNVTLSSLSRRAKFLGCKFALYGHTHVPYIMEEKGITIMNPGSLGRPFCEYPSYGIIESTESGFCAKIVYIRT